MSESGIFEIEDDDIVRLDPDRSQRARAGYVNIGVHAVYLKLSDNGDLVVECHARENEGEPIQCVSVSHQQAVDAGGEDPEYEWNDETEPDRGDQPRG